MQYCAKYATKCGPRSQTVKEVYRSIVGALNDEDKSLKAIQKLLISTVGERDFSAQETCHLLLQLPLYCATRDFIILSLDDCRIVEDHLDNQRPATAPSPLDHYIACPNSPLFQSMSLLHFTQNYSMPTTHRSEVVRKCKSVVVIVKPHLSSDTDGPQYEQYCKQQLMLHKPFRQISSLIAGFDTFIEAYTAYTRSNEIPSSLENDIQQINTQTSTDNQYDNDEDDAQNDIHHQNIEEWMMLCRAYPMLESQTDVQEEHDWNAAAQRYPNLSELPSFISCHRDSVIHDSNSNVADVNKLVGKQLLAYRIVKQHFESNSDAPLRIIVSGTAGTGKSYLIQCLKQFLGQNLKVVAPTGVTAFNVQGYTIHNLLDIQVKGEFKDLTGDRLLSLQQRFTGVKYIIIDVI